MMGGYGMGLWAWIAMGVLWAVVIALIAAVAVRVLRADGDLAAGQAAGIGPLEVLDQRYARGEIETDEYLLRRRTIAEHDEPG